MILGSNLLPSNQLLSALSWMQDGAEIKWQPCQVEAGARQWSCHCYPMRTSSHHYNFRRSPGVLDGIFAAADQGCAAICRMMVPTLAAELKTVRRRNNCICWEAKSWIKQSLELEQPRGMSFLRS